MISLSLNNDFFAMLTVNHDDPQRRIAVLKRRLAKTDYKAIKYAEGLISEEDYAPIKAQRQAWRDQINELEETMR